MSSTPRHQTEPRGKSPLFDSHGRPVDYARISVTSQCNLRCSYCMREEHEKEKTSSFTLGTGEISRIIEVLAGLGVVKIRFTGGEPLLRSDIVELVERAKNTRGIRKVTMTTNGVLLDRYFQGLADAGLDSLNISIDTLDRERYRAITRRDEFARVRANLSKLLETQSMALKLNVVMMRGINTDEIRQFVELTRDNEVTVRFLELQPFDDHQIWRTGKFLGAEKIMAMLTELYPDLERTEGGATEFFGFNLPACKGSVAIIPAFTRNFCNRCNRIRITSDGKVISCLYDKQGFDLHPALQAGSAPERLEEIFRDAVARKPEDGKHAAGNSFRSSMSEIGG
ncbi:MAG: GTP 3',8-cyclase MoaA [Chlorobiaceae bacterium]|nr:GTP 3',8-cyclase MoaA [Chlorobiaceae bacterium]NTW10345.1 GTP 3',8-cyclase MoaA [Chlorobiaceae bacterium]